jgi:hypothetical protein
VAVGMIGVMVPNAFADEIPLDAKEKILEQKIPTWLKSVGGLLLENKITNDEFDNVLKFLIKTEILSSEQTSFKNFITGIEFHSNYNAIKNLQLNTQATKIIETNPRDVCIKLAMEDSKLTATERSACHRIDREYNWGFQDDSSAETIANMIPAKGLPPTYTYGGSVNTSCSISYLDERTEHYVQKIDDWMRPEHNAYESGMMSYDELYEENQRITEYYTQKYIDDISYVCR